MVAPVLALQMASYATERRFYGQLLTAIGAPFAPRATVQGYFYAWVLDGRWELINHALVMASRQKAGRQAGP